MESYLKFRFSAFDTFNYPLQAPVRLFSGEGPIGDSVTVQIESEAVRWLLRTPVARNLLWEELKLPAQTYVKAGVVEPLIADRNQKPGDIDLLFVEGLAPERSISIQAKRVTIAAKDTFRDKISRGHLGRLKDLIDQANASQKLGFHRNYAMVIIQVDGVARSDLNFLSRGITNRQLTRIYEQIIDSPIHPDVGIVYLEISQPTPVSVDKTGLVAVCVDKWAAPLDQPCRLTAGVRQLMANCRSE